MEVSIGICSLLHAVLISNILIFCTMFFCRKCINMGKRELIVATAMGIMCFCRILFPIDLRYSYDISIDGIYADLCFILKHKVIFFEKEYELWLCIATFMEVIALLKIVQFLWEYKSAVKYIKSMELFPMDVLNNRLVENGLHRKYDIRMSNDVEIPYGIGIFHKYIILPCQEYSNDELRYILQHEVQHFREGDLLIKFFTELVCRILWWNPLFRQVQDLISRSIEVRCDACVTRYLPTEEKRQYMLVLVHSIKKRNNPEKTRWMTMTSIVEGSAERLRERIFILCGINERKETKQKALAVMTGFFFFLSYCILPVPEYNAPVNEIEKNGFQQLDLEKCRLIYKSEGYVLKDDNGAIINEYEKESDTVRKIRILINNEGTLSPSRIVDKIETNYRVRKGLIQYCRWNATKGRWVDPVWRNL